MDIKHTIHGWLITAGFMFNVFEWSRDEICEEMEQMMLNLLNDGPYLFL